MPGPRLVTDRLELVAATGELVAAEIADLHRFAGLLGVPTPGDWPPPLNDADSMAFTRDRLAEGPGQAGWWCWYLLLRPEAGGLALIGN